MKVLNIEDTAVKHADLCKVLRKSGITDIDWVKNLEDALKQLEDQSNSYDLVITDMYYPLEQGGTEVEAGEILMQRMKDMQLMIPMIVCSSVRLKIPDILGTVYYSKNSDWERQLQDLICLLY